MKRAVVFIIFFLCVNCTKETPKQVDKQFCDVQDAKNDLPWLKAIIDLAKTDKTGNYLGYIWAEEYMGKDVVFIDMAMGSGGLAGYWFNCDGTKLEFSPKNIPITTQKNLIYRNLPLN